MEETYTLTEEIIRPSTYLGLNHPVIPFDSDCNHCELGKTRQRHNDLLEENKPRAKSVGGAGPDDLSKVKLIVLSDFSGHYESLCGFPFFDTVKELGERDKRGLLRPHNAGGMIRMALELMYGLDTYTEVWMTNALKCDPGKNKPKFNSHVKPCAIRWLESELSYLADTCPNVPILVAGGVAFEAVKLLYQQEALQLKDWKLNGCRRREGITLAGRPAVFTLNPSRPSRCEPRLETTIRMIKGQLRVMYNDWLYPPLLGSPVYSFIEDLKFLAPYL